MDVYFILNHAPSIKLTTGGLVPRDKDATERILNAL